MTTLKTLLCAAALTGAAAAAQAAPFGGDFRFDRHDRFDRHERAEAIDQRQARLEARIRHGLAEGTLTRAEARRLREGQQEIRRAEAAAMADGRLSWREYARLDALLDDARRDIARQVNDRQVSRRF